VGRKGAGEGEKNKFNIYLSSDLRSKKRIRIQRSITAQGVQKDEAMISQKFPFASRKTWQTKQQATSPSTFLGESSAPSALVY